MTYATDDDTVETNSPPAFAYGEKVCSKKHIKNDGTFPGKEVGDRLVWKGDVGYVADIGQFLNRYYIYSVDFVERGYRVGMRLKELESLDKKDTEE